MNSAILFVLGGMGIAQGAMCLLGQQWNEAAILYLFSLVVIGIAAVMRNGELSKNRRK